MAFIGGVAANKGMKKAIKDVFSLEEEEFFIPERFTSIGAIGAVYTLMDEPSLKGGFAGFEMLDEYLSKTEAAAETHKPLRLSEENLRISYEVKEAKERQRAYLGVDVGSISTNLVLIDENRNVLAKRYLMTEGRPIEAVQRGLAEIGAEIADKIEVIGAGTTGSADIYTADFIGADIVRNEITAQQVAAIIIDLRWIRYSR